MTNLVTHLEKFKNASLITAIKTPYLNNGDIDLSSYDALVERQIAAGIDGIIVGGTTGEGHLLSKQELLTLISHSVEKFKGKILIVGNTGSMSTRQASISTKAGFEAGMDAALQINPYYGQTSEAGIIAHLEQLLTIGPAFVYNVPGRTGCDLTPNIIEKVAQSNNFIGVKECAGNERIAYYEKQGIACWSGNDDEAHDGRHNYHSHGLISVSSNLLPEVFRSLMDKQDEALNESVKPLIEWLFCEPNPIAINTALSLTGAVNPVFRLPYVPLSDSQITRGIELMKPFKDQLVGEHLALLVQHDFIVNP
jgi:4-hydroxy-tetrahydrodipicolinate synthase